jgi:PAS domain-containing protein
MLESESQKNNNHLRLLIDHMLEGFAYCEMHYANDKPNDFTYWDVNPKFYELTGLNNVIGKKVSEVIPGIQHSNPQIFERYGRVSSTGNPELFETYVNELAI